MKQSTKIFLLDIIQYILLLIVLFIALIFLSCGLHVKKYSTTRSGILIDHTIPCNAFEQEQETRNECKPNCWPIKEAWEDCRVGIIEEME